MFIANRYNQGMKPQITSERRKQLSQKHGVNDQYLYQCLTGRRDISPAIAMRLELETKGELKRQMLCQKTYSSIWPNLKPWDGIERRTTNADRRAKAVV